MSSLEQLLKSRIGGDNRALTAVIEDNRGSIRLLFGAIGALPRIILSVSGDEVLVLYPERDNDASRDLSLEEAGYRDRDGNLIPKSSSETDRDLYLSNLGKSIDSKIEPPNFAAGEFVEDNDPLKPGENPADAVARIAAEGGVVEPRAGDGAGAPVGSGLGTTGQTTDPALSEVKEPDGGSGDQAFDATRENGGSLNGLTSEQFVDGENPAQAPAFFVPSPAPTPAPAPVQDLSPQPVPPVFVVHKDHNKEALLELASKTPGVEYNGEMTKAQLAEAINKASGATATLE